MRYLEADCFLKLKASQMARDRNLIESGSEIDCQYDEICTGKECFLAQDPQTRTIKLEQSGRQEVPSGSQRFFRKLEAWAEKRNQSFQKDN